VAQNRGMVMTLATWLLWAMLPAGYAVAMIQRLVANPASLVSPRRTASEIIAALRTREGP